MAGMSKKEIARLLDHIEPQGVELTRTTKGVLLRLPDKTTTMVHFTGSDVREAKNVRARLKRAGVTWPTDGGTDLGATITDIRPQDRTLRRVSAALLHWDERTINGSQLRRLVAEQSGGESLTNVTAQRALYHLGWTPTGKSTSRKWLRPLELEPEPAHLEAAPVAAAEHVAAEPLEAPQPPQLSLVPDDARPAELGPTAPAEPQPDPDAELHPGSWAMAIDQLPNDTSVTQLWCMLSAMGLEGEIRVWRA